MVENGFAILLRALVRWVDNNDVAMVLEPQQQPRLVVGVSSFWGMIEQVLRILKELVAVTVATDSSSFSSSSSPLLRNNSNALQRAMPRAMPAWMRLLLDYGSYQQQPQQPPPHSVIPNDDDQDDENSSRSSSNVALLLLLQIANASIWRCEANKKLWMKTTIQTTPQQPEDDEEEENAAPTTTTSFGELLLGLMKKCIAAGDANDSSSDDDDLGVWVCHVLTALCTFDDFRAAGNNGNDAAAAPVVQSGHAHVQQLVEHGAVVRTVHQFLVSSLSTNGDDDDSAAVAVQTAAVSTLRSLAIQDDVVQSMVAEGVLDTACRLLQQHSSSEQPALATAILGLLRNLAANDGIKRTLCRGGRHLGGTATSTTVVELVVQAMRAHTPDRRSPAGARLRPDGRAGAVPAAKRRHPRDGSGAGARGNCRGHGAASGVGPAAVPGGARDSQSGEPG